MAALAVVVAGTFAAFAQWTRLDSIAPAAAASPCCGVWQIVPDGAMVRIEPQALSGQFTISVVDSPDYAIAPGTVMGTMSEIAGNGRYHASLLTHPMRGNGSSRRDCIVEVQDNNLVFRPYRARTRLSLRRWVSYLFRIAIDHAESPEGLEGAVRIAPGSGNMPITL